MIGNVSNHPPVQAAAAPQPKPQVYGPVLPETAPKPFDADTAPKLKLKQGDFIGPPVSFDLAQYNAQDHAQDPVSEAASAALSIKKSGLSTDADFIAPGAKIGLKVSAKRMKLEDALLHHIPVDKRPRDYRAMVTLRIPLGGQ